MSADTATKTPLPVIQRRPADGREAMAATGIALRAIAEFVCLGSECEDTCCAGQSIPLSADDLARMENASGAPETRADFESMVVPEPSGHVGGTVATLHMPAGSRCAFLDERRLCSIHRDFGAEAVPTVCGLFPRRISIVEGRLEMTPLLACPEATRRLLLDEASTEVVDIDVDEVGRIVVNQVVPPNPSDPYELYMDDVRALVLDLMEIEDVPFQTRQFLVAAFANLVHPFFGRGHGFTDEQRLAAALRTFRRSETLAELWGELDAVHVPTMSAVRTAYEVFAPLATESPALAELFQRAHATYGQGAEVEQRFVERMVFWDTHAHERLDQYFARFSINAWVQGYLDTASLLENARLQAVQVQILRFLILGDVELEAARNSFDWGNEADLVRALDEAAVRTFYKFARATGRDPEFWPKVNRALDARGVDSLPELVRLIKN